MFLKDPKAAAGKPQITAIREVSRLDGKVSKESSKNRVYFLKSACECPISLCTMFRFIHNMKTPRPPNPARSE